MPGIKPGRKDFKGFLDRRIFELITGWVPERQSQLALSLASKKTKDSFLGLMLVCEGSNKLISSSLSYLETDSFLVLMLACEGSNKLISSSLSHLETVRNELIPEADVYCLQV